MFVYLRESVWIWHFRLPNISSCTDSGRAIMTVISAAVDSYYSDPIVLKFDAVFGSLSGCLWVLPLDLTIAGRRVPCNTQRWWMASETPWKHVSWRGNISSDSGAVASRRFRPLMPGIFKYGTAIFLSIIETTQTPAEIDNECSDRLPTTLHIPRNEGQSAVRY